ncbi:Ig-like domain-containing protein [Bacillus sp. FJAT-42315]|uniref:Ig-like domain-containing protein n=1 Tax=Bacillus sp. FJAT-42315 TaxID=2014077 RepID=UPI000C24E73A|nr:Ig-like domain-containing protein [Bacillus sp. FJAT-42315]
MKKSFILLLILSCCLFFWIPEATAKTFEPKMITNPMKSWNISFNNPVKGIPNDSDSIYISSPSGDKHPISYELSKDQKMMKIIPSEPYLIGKSYTLVIKQGVESAKGKKLKEDVVMNFQLQGQYIKSIEAALNPLATNVKVQGTDGVAAVKVSINKGSETPLHPNSNYLFTRGFIGLMNGDLLQIRAYNQQGKLIEEQTYQIGS